MKILVTGATGFIGQHVIRCLLKRTDLEIIGTTRDLNKAKKIDFYEKIKFIEIDLSMENRTVFHQLDSPDILIHLAWDNLPNYNEHFHIKKNLVENKKFIFNMINSGLNDITVSGTCFEYGMKSGCLHEKLIASPINRYGISKNSLRIFTEDLQIDFDFSFKWLRLFYTFGEGQGSGSLIAQIEKTAASSIKKFNMSGGDQIRDYLPVNEMAELIVRCSLQKKIDGIINCCSGKPISIKNLVGNYIKEKGYDIKINFGAFPYPDYEPMAFWGDNRKLNEVLLNEKK
ncbi:NAD-dependent epimerase/dehydratase family protein [Candidatus Methylopumilus planktonicus]|uniref:NAD-dependent epimerase/dehydratase family protein n=1 Tax=Candidatus Methylopumilus planktonicus TaxID=1581557 RepID=UPI003D1883A1